MCTLDWCGKSMEEYLATLALVVAAPGEAAAGTGEAFVDGATVAAVKKPVFAAGGVLPA